MIVFPSHPQLEIRVLRIVLSRPPLLDAVPNLGVDDFWNPWHRLLWSAIRNAMEHDPAPSSPDDLRAACAEIQDRVPGALPENAHGILASSLRGEPRRKMYMDAISLAIFQPDTRTPEATLRAELVAASETLSYSRRARERMQEQRP